MAIWQNNLVKGSSMRQNLQNSKGCGELLEFLSELGAIYFKKKSLQLEVNSISSSLDSNFFCPHTHTHAHTRARVHTHTHTHIQTPSRSLYLAHLRALVMIHSMR